MSVTMPTTTAQGATTQPAATNTRPVKVGFWNERNVRIAKIFGTVLVITLVAAAVFIFVPHLAAIIAGATLFKFAPIAITAVVYWIGQKILKAREAPAEEEARKRSTISPMRTAPPPAKSEPETAVSISNVPVRIPSIPMGYRLQSKIDCPRGPNKEEMTEDEVTKRLLLDLKRSQEVKWKSETFNRENSSQISDAFKEGIPDSERILAISLCSQRLPAHVLKAWFEHCSMQNSALKNPTILDKGSTAEINSDPKGPTMIKGSIVATLDVPSSPTSSKKSKKISYISYMANASTGQVDMDVTDLRP
jgi:hypothetical protein